MPSNQVSPTMLNLHKCCLIFENLVLLSKKGEGNSQLIFVAIKSGCVFIQTFGKYVSWLSDHFKNYKEGCMKIFKSVQNGTRQIQILCAHTKAELGAKKSLVSQIPKVKKVLEKLIFDVKILITNNGYVDDAFEIGNLKHKNLHGEYISSQVFREEDEQQETKKKRKKMRGMVRRKSSLKRLILKI